ncbi:MAG: hypothetical protein RIR00_1660, partial [Pseudomonadota bacterium]
MNHVYRLIWNDSLSRYVPAPEMARAKGKSGGVKLLTLAISALLAGPALAGPTGGSVTAGQGTINQSGSQTTINQSSQNLSLNWQSFSIGNGELVRFVQPNASAVALNRVTGNSVSEIYGVLQANGQVFLINPNGVLFGQGAQVDVGGLVASTLNLSDSDFLAGKRVFSGNGGDVSNQGTINAAEGGYVALLGRQVSNDGTISARMGTVALAGGSQVTLDISGSKLVDVQVNQSALKALAENRQVLRADGGTVILTAAAKDALMDTVVNNSGVIEARTVQNVGGKIRLLGDMESGTVQVGGKLDASAPNGGDGGDIDTSGAHVKVTDNAVITTAAAAGKTGTWVVDPNDYNIAASGGDISGATLGQQLANTNVTILSTQGKTSGQGDIQVADAVSWNANNTLTLSAQRNIDVKSVISASGNSAGLVLASGTGGSGSYRLIGNARIDLGGNNPLLIIDGKTYTVVNTVAGLQDMNKNLTGYYALGSKLDASATAGWNGGAGFAPVGNGSAPFYGVFDGLGHQIGNLVIYRPNTNAVGLFGDLGLGGAIRNITLQDATVTGKQDVGALVGYNDGAISNASSTNGAVSGQYAVGGLVGNNGVGSLSAVATGGSVSASNYYVGGLVGYNAGNISDATSQASVTG